MQTSTHASPQQSQSRRWPYIIAGAGLLAVILAWTLYPARTPPLSIHFTGKLSPGYHKNPFGNFIITNQGTGPLTWALDGVEAPDDPDLRFSQSLDSNIPQGTLHAGQSTNFPAMVPHTKDIPFRVHIFGPKEPDVLDRLRAKLPTPLPIINRLWPKTLTGFTYTSQWFKATADYRRSQPDPDSQPGPGE